MSKSVFFAALPFYSPEEKGPTHTGGSSLSLLGAWVLALAAGLPVQAETINANVTTIWYEPHCDNNSIFVGSFRYDTSTHAVTNLKGVLSESMTGDSVQYDPATGPNGADSMTWLSLNYQLANGDASHTYTWYDAAKGGTFATVFKNNDSLTFATSVTISGVTYTGDGWSPAGGLAVKSRFPKSNNPQNAYALIFVPDSLASANRVALAWKESTATGSLGLAYTAYADNTEGGYMGSVGMTGISKSAYGKVGTMGGYPLSEEINGVPEPSTMVLAIIGCFGLLFRFRRR